MKIQANSLAIDRVEKRGGAIVNALLYAQEKTGLNLDSSLQILIRHYQKNGDNKSSHACYDLRHYSKLGMEVAIAITNLQSSKDDTAKALQVLERGKKPREFKYLDSDEAIRTNLDLALCARLLGDDENADKFIDDALTLFEDKFLTSDRLKHAKKTFILIGELISHQAIAESPYCHKRVSDIILRSSLERSCELSAKYSQLWKLLDKAPSNMLPLFQAVSANLNEYEVLLTYMTESGWNPLIKAKVVSDMEFLATQMYTHPSGDKYTDIEMEVSGLMARILGENGYQPKASKLATRTYNLSFSNCQLMGIGRACYEHARQCNTSGASKLSHLRISTQDQFLERLKSFPIHDMDTSMITQGCLYLGLANLEIADQLRFNTPVSKPESKDSPSKFSDYGLAQFRIMYDVLSKSKYWAVQANRILRALSICDNLLETKYPNYVSELLQLAVDFLDSYEEPKSKDFAHRDVNILFEYAAHLSGKTNNANLFKKIVDIAVKNCEMGVLKPSDLHEICEAFAMGVAYGVEMQVMDDSDIKLPALPFYIYNHQIDA